MVQPIGPLMIEHRLIERMISIVKKKTEMMEKTGVADVDFIEAAVNFIKTYADRCHHGKEEDILFRDLKKKKMDPQDKKVMEELIQEHVKARELTGTLVVAKERYASGDKATLIAILDILRQLVDFYPKHIEKEDKVFFKPSMQYLTKAERNKMLEEEYEFDRKFIHRVYEEKVAEHEEK